MASQKHLDILRQGVDALNKWRKEYRDYRPDLSGADLSGAILSEADLSRADLSGADLSGADLFRADLFRADLSGANLWGATLSGANLGNANLRKANLRETDLSGADLSEADLSGANLSGLDLSEADLSGANLSGLDLSFANLSKVYDLSELDLSEADLSFANLSGLDLSDKDLRGTILGGANLSGANLSGLDLSDKDLRGTILGGANLSRANLSGADLSGAILIGADLKRATLVNTNCKEAVLNNCSIYGISAWDVQLQDAKQDSLIITRKDEPVITVDNLKVAQFIYLLLDNKEIREVIDTITSKVVLILGRFTPERKAVLDALRSELRKRNYSPVLFDFEKPSNRNYTETVRTLAHLARFIIADLTDPSSIPQELQAIIPTLAVPVQPVLLEGKSEYAMFIDFLKTYHWVLPIHYYKDQADLLSTVNENVIVPAEQKAQELEKR